MYAVVRLTAAAIPGNDLLRLVAEVAAGAACYLLLSALFRLEAFRELVAIVRRQLKKRTALSKGGPFVFPNGRGYCRLRVWCPRSTTSAFMTSASSSFSPG